MRGLLLGLWAASIEIAAPRDGTALPPPVELAVAAGVKAARPLPPTAAELGGALDCGAGGGHTRCRKRMRAWAGCGGRQGCSGGMLRSAAATRWAYAVAADGPAARVKAWMACRVGAEGVVRAAGEMSAPVPSPPTST